MSKDNDDSDNDKYNLAKHKHKTIASSNGWKLAPLTGAVHNKNNNAIIPTTRMMITMIVIILARIIIKI